MTKVTVRIGHLHSAERTQVLLNTYKTTRGHENPWLFDDQSINDPFNRGYAPFNLYVLELKEVVSGEEVFYFDKFIKKIRSSGGAEYGDKQEVIIGTTDVKYLSKGIPKIPQEFVEQWCVKVGGISKAVVNYCVKTVTKGTNESDFYEEDTKIIKLNSLNEIEISQLKESYTLDEVYKLCLKSYIRGGIDESITGATFEKWSEEHLGQ